MTWDVQIPLVIDFAHGAASQLKMMQVGEVPVKLEILA